MPLFIVPRRARFNKPLFLRIVVAVDFPESESGPSIDEIRKGLHAEVDTCLDRGDFLTKTDFDSVT